MVIVGIASGIGHKGGTMKFFMSRKELRKDGAQGDGIADLPVCI